MTAQGGQAEIERLGRELVEIGKKVAGLERERARLEAEGRMLRESRDGLKEKYLASQSTNNGLRYGYEMLALRQKGEKIC